MGKSDPIVFNFYLKNLETKTKYDKVAIFGQVSENNFTKNIISNSKTFYDLQLKNWNINEFPYKIKEKFDLIVCTRCAYFSKEPEKLINSFIEALKDDGTLLIDWGLGDHWRFDDFKVGWVKNNQQEYAYSDDNFLWSTVWHDRFSSHVEFLKFEKEINKFGYFDLKSAILKEVPSILDLNSLLTNKKVSVECDMLTLWPQSPQLYILLKMRKL